MNDEKDLPERVIYACDVGSTLKKNFGWARISALSTHSDEVRGHRSIEKLAEWIEFDLRSGRSVALGFESPGYIPVPVDAGMLSKRRSENESPSWSGKVGCYVGLIGLHQCAWLLKRMDHLKTEVYATLDVSKWRSSKIPSLLLWEAFVSGAAHNRDGRCGCPIKDGATAAMWFLEWERACSVDCHLTGKTASESLSLLGAALVWSEWSTDLACLKAFPLVIRPIKEFESNGEIELIGDIPRTACSVS
ncbi:hypothetical protein [Verrucomicrobium spinosum]|nr:hypothetical protein [Verrucomicrobium spinosum]